MRKSSGDNQANEALRYQTPTNSSASRNVARSARVEEQPRGEKVWNVQVPTAAQRESQLLKDRQKWARVRHQQQLELLGRPTDYYLDVERGDFNFDEWRKKQRRLEGIRQKKLQRNAEVEMISVVEPDASVIVPQDDFERGDRHEEEARIRREVELLQRRMNGLATTREGSPIRSMQSPSPGMVAGSTLALAVLNASHSPARRRVDPNAPTTVYPASRDRLPSPKRKPPRHSEERNSARPDLQGHIHAPVLQDNSYSRPLAQSTPSARHTTPSRERGNDTAMVSTRTSREREVDDVMELQLSTKSFSSGESARSNADVPQLRSSSTESGRSVDVLADLTRGAVSYTRSDGTVVRVPVRSVKGSSEPHTRF